MLQGKTINNERASALTQKLFKTLRQLIEATGGDPRILDLIKFEVLAVQETKQAEKNNGRLILKKIREHLGYSQEQFAAKLGVTIQTVSRWERGQASPASKRGFEVLHNSLEFTNKLADIEKNVPGTRRLYNDCLSALARPEALTRYIFSQVGLSDEIVEQIVQQNKIRVEKAHEYLKHYEFFHLYDKALVERYITNYTLPELMPGQMVKPGLLKQFIKNQIQLSQDYKNYHLALSEENSDYNFGIIEGINKVVAWIEVREHVGQPKGLFYGMYFEGGGLVQELQATFNNLWNSHKIKLRDQKAVDWLKSLLNRL